jgi:hypothetical protein
MVETGGHSFEMTKCMADSIFGCATETTHPSSFAETIARGTGRLLIDNDKAPFFKRQEKAFIPYYMPSSFRVSHILWSPYGVCTIILSFVAF